MLQTERQAQTTGQAIQDEKAQLPYKVKMEIEISRRKKINAIVDRENTVVRWLDTTHECLDWLHDKGEAGFIADTPSGTYQINFSKIPRT